MRTSAATPTTRLMLPVPWMTWHKRGLTTGLWATFTPARSSGKGIQRWYTRAILKADTPTETGARGVYLVEIESNGNVKLDFRPTDTVRWERVSVDIGDLETEQDLLNAVDDAMQSLLDGPEGRSVVTRLTLTGRGDLNHFLRQPRAADDILEGVNERWAGELPFAWCERIEDATAAPIDRDAMRAGEDFLAEVLRTADGLKESPSPLREGLGELFQHAQYRRYLSNLTDEEIAGLLNEAEALAVNLLSEEEGL